MYRVSKLRCILPQLYWGRSQVPVIETIETTEIDIGVKSSVFDLKLDSIFGSDFQQLIMVLDAQ